MTQTANITTPLPRNPNTQLRRKGRSRRALMAHLLRWWLFSLFVSGYLLLFLPGAEYPNLALVTLLPTSLALWFGLLPLIGNDGTRKLYDPVTLFNTGLFYYSLKGVALSWGDRTIFLSHIDMSQVAQIYPPVALLTALGILAWNWGYYAEGRNNRAPTDEGADSENGERRYPYINPRLGIIFLILAGGLSFYFLIRLTDEGLFIFLMQSWRRGYLSDTALSGSASAFSSLLVPGILLLPLASILWLSILGNNRQRPGMVFWAYSALMLVAVFLVMPRATFIGSLLSLLFVYHYAIRRVSLIVLVFLSVGGLVYAYAMGLWRVLSSSATGIDQAGTLLLENFSVGDLSDFVISGALSDIRTFVLVVYHYGKDLSFQFGGTLLRILTQFIPRALWPGKPIDLGVELGRLSNPYTISGTPAGFLPEMYINFHLAGVLLGAPLLGMGMRRIYRDWVLLSRNQALSLALYAVTIPRILLLPSNTISLAFVSWAIPLGAALVAVALCTTDKTSEKPLSSS